MYQILLVDDDADLLDILSYNVRRQGYQVLTAEDGREAQQILALHSIDLVVLDVMMPGLSGYEICTWLRQNETLFHLPILMYSALSLDVDRVRGLEAGADDYLAKPVTMQRLMRRIQALLHHLPLSSAHTAANILQLLPHRYVVLHRDEPVPLSRKQFELLHFLLTHADTAHSAQELFQTVWGISQESDDELIALHIRQLQEKLNLTYIAEQAPKQYQFVLSQAA